jgi:DNA transposition AAA+ family ATPase
MQMIDHPAAAEHPPLDFDSILKRVEAHLAAGLPRQRIALICDIDGDRLNRVLSGQPAEAWESGYAGVYAGPESKRVFAALDAWLSENATPIGDDAGYAVTPTFQHLQNLLSHAHQGRTLLAITGTWGVGKTQAGMFYAATHARSYREPGAVRIQFNPTDNKPAAALARIRDALATTGGAYRNGALMNSIGDALKPGDFLILDECQRLGDALDIVCSLHDDYGIGIAMIGNPDLSGKLWGKRPAFGALASRTNRFDIPHATANDVDAWLAWHGLPTGLTGTQRAGLIKACIEIATRPTQNGGLRALAHVFDTAERMYADQVLTGEFLAQLANTLKPGPQ